MSLLDSYSPDLQTGAVNATVPRPTVPQEPGVFDNFASGAGRYFMRSMAETGRAIDLLGAVGPIAIDKITGGTERQDAYFREHDEVFQSAVDYWTPKPGEVGAAGQVVGQLAGGVLQFLANPALMVGTAQMSTAQDLVRQGVDADAALVAGDVAALATVAGIALPIAGKSLASRVATGMAGNVATSIPEAALKREIVTAAGRPDVAAQFDPWDMRARAVDLMLGAVFGVKAHIDASAVQKDALMSMNAARHLEEVATPARAADPVELTKGVDNVRTAMEQMLRGEPVNVPHQDVAPGEVQAIPQRPEIEQLVAEELRPMTGEPIKRPDMTAPEVQGKPRDLQAEMIQMRKTDAVLARLLECIG